MYFVLQAILEIITSLGSFDKVKVYIFVISNRIGFKLKVRRRKISLGDSNPGERVLAGLVTT